MAYAGETLTVSVTQGVARLTFMQPRSLNALSPAMAGEFLAVCRLLGDRDDIQVLVLQGSGRAFMAGGDLHALGQDPEGAISAIIPHMHEAVRLLKTMPLIIVARLHGAVAGAGLSLACLADLSIAQVGTRFVYAYSDIAATCDLGLSWHLVRRVGLSRAMEIALLGHGFNARQAAEWGLVNQVVDESRVDEVVDEWVARLAVQPAHVTRATKLLLMQAQDAALDEQLDLEHRMFLECARHPTFKAAIERFFAHEA
jgi:2-(1,2-epoxy-1,2-dihydrophenyl)acetyl-CoA isomerase